MRVLMFCPQFAPVIGGAERQAERLGKQLVAAGLAVEIWTPRLDPASPTVEMLEGLPVRRFALSNLAGVLPAIPGIGVVKGPWIVAQLMVRLWRPIGRCDVVHCHIGSLQTVAVALAARLRGRPVICKAAMAEQNADLGEMVRSGLAGRCAAWAARRVFTRWVATTQAVRAALARAGVADARITVIPNGVVVPTTPARQPRGPVRRFLYLGRLSNNANRDTPGLIANFDTVADEFPDAELALVGGGDLLAATRIAAAACRHASRIQVTGPGDANQWLEWADCFVLPSRREGLSNALLEAMAGGLPCIAYDIPPNREVLADGAAGWLVLEDGGALPPQFGLATAMRGLATDDTLAQKYARSALARIHDEYDLKSVAKSYVALYSTLAKLRKFPPRAV